MQTMTQMLVERDRKAFIRYFDALKNGEKPQTALERVYGFKYPGLVKEWRQYISK